jgi:hypothetical protein
LTDGQLGPLVGVDATQELAGIGALDIDLAQGRGIEDADLLAHRQALAGHRLRHALTFAVRGVGAYLWKVPGALPLAHVLELGAVLHVPLVQGGVALGVEQLAAVTANDGAEGHRRVVGPEHRGAHLGDRLVQAAGGNGHAVDVAELALVGAKAHGGVALDVLDGLEALAGGQLDGRRR